MDKLKIVVTLPQAINGYWDGGPKSRFEFTSSAGYRDGYTEWGSWGANHFFNVKNGKSYRACAATAARMIRANITRNYPEAKIEILEDCG